MAEVHLAESVGPMSFRKQVAIKRLLPQFAQNKRYIQMLLDEAHIAGAISHPNVAQVIDLGQVEGVHFIAMEFVNGVDLAGVLQTLRLHDRELPLAIALHMARCVARGLHAAHTLVDADGQHLRVVHRDVSPHNVLISLDGEVKLIDFGVAKAETNLTMTRSGVIKGKLQYMSPEQAKAETVDCRADVFSLGMTLYKMLVGRLPFSGTNEFQIYDEILRKRAAPPSTHRKQIPERVDALVLRALRKNPLERFQTADEMAVVLDRAVDELGGGVSSADIAQWLSRELPSDQRFSSHDDDDFRAVERLTPPPADSWDDERIERLTRAEEGVTLMPTVRATLDGRSLERRAVSSAPAAPASDPGPATAAVEPAPTVQMAAFARPIEPGAASGIAAEGVADAVRALPSPAPRSWDPRPRRPLWILVGLVVTLAVTLSVLLVQETGDGALSRPPGAGRLTASIAPPDPPSVAPFATSNLPWDRGSAGVPDLGSTPSRPAPASGAPSSPVPSPPVRPREGPPKAWLTVSTLPWAWVHIDGQRLARHTPVVGVPIKPGRHAVRLKTGDGRTHTVEINLRAGQRLTVSHAFK